MSILGYLFLSDGERCDSARHGGTSGWSSKENANPTGPLKMQDRPHLPVRPSVSQPDGLTGFNLSERH